MGDAWNAQVFGTRVFGAGQAAGVAGALAVLLGQPLRFTASHKIKHSILAYSGPTTDTFIVVGPIEEEQANMAQQATAGITVLTCVYFICYFAADAPIYEWREVVRLIAHTLAILGLDLLLSALVRRPLPLEEMIVASALFVSFAVSVRLFAYYRVLQNRGAR